MICIHNHLLPGVDDGVKTFEEAKELLDEGYKSGITKAILTPHFVNRKAGYNSTVENNKTIFNDFKEYVKDIPVDLYLGNELFIDPKLDEMLLRKEVLSLANSKYVLVEFPMTYYRDEYDEILYNITVSGYRVIIAHPERYSYVQEDYRFAEQWLKEGYLLQSNADSLNNHNTKKVIKKLLDKDMLTFIATDAHNKYRPFKLADAYRFVEKHYGKERAEDLFVNNPQKILI